MALPMRPDDPKSDAEVVGGMFGKIFLGMLILGLLSVPLSWFELRPGTHCQTVDMAHAAVDMPSLKRLKSAIDLQDGMGVSELIASEKVFLIPKETGGLLLDT